MNFHADWAQAASQFQQNLGEGWKICDPAIGVLVDVEEHGHALAGAEAACAPAFEHQRVDPTVEIDDPAMRVIGRVIEWRRGGKL